MGYIVVRKRVEVVELLERAEKKLECQGINTPESSCMDIDEIGEAYARGIIGAIKWMIDKKEEAPLK